MHARFRVIRACAHTDLAYILCGYPYFPTLFCTLFSLDHLDHSDHYDFFPVTFWLVIFQNHFEFGGQRAVYVTYWTLYDGKVNSFQISF